MMMYRLTTVLLVILSTLLFAGPQADTIPLTTQSDDALQLFLRGRDLAEKLRGQESIRHYQRAVELDPNFAIAHLNLALVQPTAKDFFESLNRAKELADKVSEGERLWILGVDAGVNGFPMKQREYYLKLVQLYPNDERAHNLLGTHYFAQQEYDKAIAEYSRAIRINPGFSQAYNQLGYAYRFIGNYDESEKSFQAYIELIPDDPNPYDSYAELLMKMGKYEPSIEQYKKALGADPNFVASHIGIATNLNLMGKHSEAREQLKKLQSMARNEGEQRAALFAMAISYVYEAQMEKALEMMEQQYQMGAKINDHAAMAGDLIAMGNIYYEMGQFDKAKSIYEKANQTIQNSGHKKEIKDNAQRNYLYNSARVALMQKDLTTARARAEEFRKAVNAIQNQPQIWLSHEIDGLIALQEKDYEKAIEELKQANVQNPYTHYRLASVYLARGDKENARIFFSNAAEHNTLNSMQHAFIRAKARKMLTSL
ncbi:MAG: tetratricopeptide repeat protein [Calditrichia bacterium]